ncbi:unnamed protein product [Tilletia controversa]|nr:unnamed protein product [Tilletia controversa]CAD6947239.1 unnamed protein product [Tilletia controversa]
MSCLPYVTVQHDFPQVFDDVAQGTVAAERIWLSVYALNGPTASIHARLLLISGEPERDEHVGQQDGDGGGGVYIAEIKPENQLTVARVKDAPKNLVVSSTFRPAEDSIAPPSTSARHPQQRIFLPPVHCLAPRYTIPYPSSTSALRLRKGVSPHISAFDVSPSGNGLYVAGAADGKCWIGRLPGSTGAPNEAQSKPLVVLDGHVGDITNARFFPSGEVVVTTGSDFRVCIFSALPPDDSSAPPSTSPPINTPVRTLTGHTRAPTATAILGKGRFILSGGRDGYIRCWNVGEAREVGNLPASEAVVSSLFPPSIENMILGPDPHAEGRADDNGTGLSEQEEVFPGPFPLLAVGLSSGEVVIHDLRRCTLGAQTSTNPQSINKGAPAKPVKVRPSETLCATLPSPIFPPGPPLDASDPAQAWTSKRHAGAVSSINWDRARHLLIAGYSSGVVAIHRVRNLISPQDESTTPVDEVSTSLVAMWKRNEAAITHIELVPTEDDDTKTLRIVVTTSDGLACRLRLDVSSSSDLAVPALETEYIGWECGDAIGAAKWVPQQRDGTAKDVQRGRLVLAGAEGVLRLY